MKWYGEPLGQNKNNSIYCCSCNKYVDARLTNGKEIYRKHINLHSIPLWICDGCGNYVGCHYKTNDPTKPLGSIPTCKIRKLRRQIHEKLDTLWMDGRYERSFVYRIIADGLGKSTYHTAEICSVEEAETVLKILKYIS